MTNRNNPAWSARQLAVIERLWPLPVHQDAILAEINTIRVGEVRRTHSALETVARRLKIPRNAEWLQARKIESAGAASGSHRNREHAPRPSRQRRAHHRFRYSLAEQKAMTAEPGDEELLAAMSVPMLAGTQRYWDDLVAEGWATTINIPITSDGIYSEAADPPPHPVPEGEPSAPVFPLRYDITTDRKVPVDQAWVDRVEAAWHRHYETMRAKDTEIASLKAEAENARIVTEVHEGLMTSYRTEIRELIQRMYDNQVSYFLEKDALKAEITRLTSQQNSAETKAGFPAFNSAAGKPPA